MGGTGESSAFCGKKLCWDPAAAIPPRAASINPPGARPPPRRSPPMGQKNEPAQRRICGWPKAPLCRVLPSFEPAGAGGIVPAASALACAYRVHRSRSNPLSLVLAQNGLPHHQHSRAEPIYTMIGPACKCARAGGMHMVIVGIPLRGGSVMVGMTFRKGSANEFRMHPGRRAPNGQFAIRRLRQERWALMDGPVHAAVGRALCVRHRRFASPRLPLRHHHPEMQFGQLALVHRGGRVGHHIARRLVLGKGDHLADVGLIAEDHA